jgi:hypothetical protein
MMMSPRCRRLLSPPFTTGSRGSCVQAIADAEYAFGSVEASQATR